MPLPVYAEDTTPPLANGLQTFRPTYILGFGGTGTRIAARVHQMAMANPALREHDNKLFAFAGIDTNDGDLDLDLVRGNIKEDFRFRMSRPYTSIRQFTAGIHARLTDFQTWIDLNPIIMDHDLTAGAGQKRSLSRAAWYLGMKGQLRDGLSKFLRILSQTPDVQAVGKPQVYIVSSVSGGTGAGGSMLLGRYVKHYLTSIADGAAIPVIGMLLMSDIFAASPNGRGQHDAILANGYAYLKELEAIYKRAAYMDPEAARVAGLVDLDFGDGLEASAMPFDSTFLVSQGNTKLARFPESANFYLYEQMMAQALYARIFCRDVATGTYGAENNKIDFLLRNQENPASAATCRYSTLGSSVLLYAKQDAIDYMTTSILCKKMISDEWKTLDANYEKQRADYLARQKAGETGLEQPRRHACFAEMIEAANSPTNSARPKQLVSSIYRDVVPAADSTPRYKTFIEAVQDEIRRSLQEALARKIQEHPTAAGYLQQFRNDPFASLRDFIREQTGKHEYVEQMSIIRELENDYLDVVERILVQIVTSQQLMVEDAVLKPEDTIHRDMWPEYRLGRYLNPEMSFFGLRYFASALLCDIERELSGIDSQLDSLATRYDGIVGRDFDPQRKGIDDADAVAVILGNLNPLQARMQNSKIQRFITEFERYFNERMDTLREINELKIRKSVYTRLARVLGENSAEGGFLGLHYLATDQLIARSPKMLHNAEASKGYNSKAHERFANIIFVYSSEAAKDDQWKSVSDEYDANADFAGECYRSINTAFLHDWHTILDMTTQGRSSESTQIHGSLAAHMGKTLEQGISSRLSTFKSIDLSILDAARKEAILKNVPSADIPSYLDKLIKTAYEWSEPFSCLPVTEAANSLDFLICDVQKGREVRDAFEHLTNRPGAVQSIAIAEDTVFGSEVAIFSRSHICFPLDAVKDYFQGPNSFFTAYRKKIAGDPHLHIDKRFRSILEEPLPHLNQSMYGEISNLIITGLIVPDAWTVPTQFKDHKDAPLVLELRDDSGNRVIGLAGLERLLRQKAARWQTASADRIRRLVEADSAVPLRNAQLPRLYLDLLDKIAALDRDAMSDMERIFVIGYVPWLNTFIQREFAPYLKAMAAAGAGPTPAP